MAINLEQKEMIIEFVQDNRERKASAVGELLNLKSSRVRKILAELCEEGVLKKHGEKRGIYYTLNDE